MGKLGIRFNSGIRFIYLNFLLSGTMPEREINHQKLCLYECEPNLNMGNTSGPLVLLVG